MLSISLYPIMREILAEKRIRRYIHETRDNNEILSTAVARIISELNGSLGTNNKLILSRWLY